MCRKRSQRRASQITPVASTRHVRYIHIYMHTFVSRGRATGARINNFTQRRVRTQHAILYAHTPPPTRREKEGGILRKERGREERRCVFTFQISRLTRTQVSFPFFEKGDPFSPSLYVFIIGTRLVIPLETCVPGPSSLICHKSAPDRTTVREFLISGRRMFTSGRGVLYRRRNYDFILITLAFVIRRNNHSPRNFQEFFKLSQRNPFMRISFETRARICIESETKK